VNWGLGISEIEQSKTYGKGEQVSLTSFGGKKGWACAGAIKQKIRFKKITVCLIALTLV
jgi:hypothetical protein